MDLMKELLSSQQEVAEEADDATQVKRFKQIYAEIESDILRLEKKMMDGSNFYKMVEKLGGDMSYFREAKESLAKVQEALEELHMSVGMKHLNMW